MSSAQPAEGNTPRNYQLFIDGQWVDAESGKTFSTPNPATGETLAEVAEADKANGGCHQMLLSRGNFSLICEAVRYRPQRYEFVSWVTTGK